MIKIPQEVKKIMETMAEKGYKSYAIGDCIRYAVMQEESLDWDVVTQAEPDKLTNIFPDALILNKEKGSIRYDYTVDDENGIILDIHTMRDSDGKITEQIEDQLKGMNFTLYAIALDIGGEIIDPCNGGEDIEKELVRCVGNAASKIKNRPALGIEAVRIVAETGYDLNQKIADAIKANMDEVSSLSLETVREEFLRIMDSPYTGKAIRMLVSTDLIKLIVKDGVKRMNKKQRPNFNLFCTNLDKINVGKREKICMFYTRFDPRIINRLVKYMNYDDEINYYLIDIFDNIRLVGGVKEELAMKSAMAKLGKKRFECMYISSLALDKIFGVRTSKSSNRQMLYKKVKESGDPVYIEDLVITVDDLKHADITDIKQAEKIMKKLLQVVHLSPESNTRVDLLTHATLFRIGRFGVLKGQFKKQK